MLRGIKVRLYPTKEQTVELNKVLGCYRFVYNHLLSLKQKAYNNDKTNLGLNELSKYLHGEFKVTWCILLWYVRFYSFNSPNQS